MSKEKTQSTTKGSNTPVIPKRPSSSDGQAGVPTPPMQPVRPINPPKE